MEFNPLAYLLTLIIFEVIILIAVLADTKWGGNDD